MKHSRATAIIDVGTSKVTALVGDIDEMGEVRVLGYGIVPAAGLARGVIDNVASAREAIQAAVEKAEQSGGLRILSASVGMSGAHVNTQNNRGIIAIPDRSRPVSADDRARALDVASQVSIPTNRMVLHIIPRAFWIDGTDQVGDPVGMYAQRLDAEVHIVSGALSAIQNLAKCVEGAGVQVDDLILSPLAAASAVLDPQERRQGVAVVDIGAGTTSIAVFAEDAITHSSVIPIAGNHLTQDLASVLRCPWDTAEALKRRHGAVLVTPSDANRHIEVEVFGSRRAAQVSLGHIAEILRARGEEIIDMVGAELRKSGYINELAAGLVLCGGTSELTGLAQVAEERLGIPVRTGTPRTTSGISEMLSAPAHATAIGLLAFALKGVPVTRDAPIPAARPVGDPPLDVLFRRMKAVVRTFVP